MATTETDIPGYPFFLQEDPDTTTPIYYSAKDFRNYTAAFFGRAGTIGTSGFRVTQATNIGFKIRVNTGYATLTGGYLTYLPADIEITLGWTTPVSGTVNHKVFIAIYDELISGNLNKAKIVITQDTGSGAPNPVGAAAYLQIAAIKVTASQPNIQNKDITNTALHGGSHAPYVDISPYLQPGYNPATGGGQPGPRAVYDNGFVHLSGAVIKASGNYPRNTELHFGDTHPNMRPKYAHYMTGTTSVSDTNNGGTMTYRLTINTDGTMTARLPNTNDCNYIHLDNITYDLD